MVCNKRDYDTIIIFVISHKKKLEVDYKQMLQPICFRNFL